MDELRIGFSFVERLVGARDNLVLYAKLGESALTITANQPIYRGQSNTFQRSLSNPAVGDAMRRYCRYYGLTHYTPKKVRDTFWRARAPYATVHDPHIVQFAHGETWRQGVCRNRPYTWLPLAAVAVHELLHLEVQKWWDGCEVLSWDFPQSISAYDDRASWEIMHEAVAIFAEREFLREEAPRVLPRLDAHFQRPGEYLSHWLGWRLQHRESGFVEDVLASLKAANGVSAMR